MKKMELYLKGDRLQILDFNVSTKSDLNYQIILDIDLKELAKALKPYLDSIDNCECKGCKR